MCKCVFRPANTFIIPVNINAGWLLMSPPAFMLTMMMQKVLAGVRTTLCVCSMFHRTRKRVLWPLRP